MNLFRKAKCILVLAKTVTVLRFAEIIADRMLPADLGLVLFIVISYNGMKNLSPEELKYLDSYALRNNGNIMPSWDLLVGRK